MRIRFAEKQDLPALVKIYNQAIAAQCIAVLEPVTPQARQAWFDEHPRESHPILIAESQDSILGYSSFSAYRPGRTALKHTAELSYFVDDKHHGQGVGSALLVACIQICPALKIKTLLAILLETNASSIALLKKFDFKQWAHLPDVAEINGVAVGQVYFGRKTESL